MEAAGTIVGNICSTMERLEMDMVGGLDKTGEELSILIEEMMTACVEKFLTLHFI